MGAIRKRKTIREYRIAAGLTQEQLAEKVAIHRISLVRYELGAAEPGGRTLLAIADALGVNASAIALPVRRRTS